MPTIEEVRDAIISLSSDVENVMVANVPGSDGGGIQIIIVLKPGKKVTAQEVRNFCCERFPELKRQPIFVSFVDGISKGETHEAGIPRGSDFPLYPVTGPQF